jgi:hypothetical protein
MRERLDHQGGTPIDPLGLIQHIQRVVIARDHILITPEQSNGASKTDGPIPKIKIPWQMKSTNPTATLETNSETDSGQNEALIQSIIRSHVWLRSLRDGTYQSIETLAEANRLHSKVVRQGLRLAFLSPDITAAILEGTHSAKILLADIPKTLPLLWHHHRELLG